MLHVIRAEHGSKAENLRPALDETVISSGKIDELWYDEWRGYAPLVYEDEQTVVHTEEYVTEAAFTPTKRMPLVAGPNVVEEVLRALQTKD